MSDVEEELRTLFPELKRFYVKSLWLFGSATHGESPRDVDVLVEFSRPPGLMEFMGLKEYLEGELNRPVDVLSRKACSPRFLKRIEHELIDVA